MMDEFSRIGQDINTFMSSFGAFVWALVALGVVGCGCLVLTFARLSDKALYDRADRVERESLHPKERRLKELGARRGEIADELSRALLPLGSYRREQLTTEKSLIDAELTHLRNRTEGERAALAERLDGMSRGGLAGQRRSLHRRREKIFTAINYGDLKPGPDVRRQLLATADEIVAVETRLGGFDNEAESAAEDSATQARLNDIITFHDEASARWGEWHTDLGLLTEFPAIHDVQHEAFARRIIDAQDAAREARRRAEDRRGDRACVDRFGEAVDEFVAALDDGEHKARLIARGPALDPVLNRIMTTAETLLAKIHAYRAGDSSVGWGECQVAADGLVKLLEPVVGHQAEMIPELEAAIARELEPARG